VKKKKACPSAQTGKTAANTARHHKEEPSHSPFSNRQLPPSFLSTTAPLETEEENRNREEKHKKKYAEKKNKDQPPAKPFPG
jgi:hypothetical protein